MWMDTVRLKLKMQDASVVSEVIRRTSVKYYKSKLIFELAQ
jgi:hypothetical protein